MRWKLKKNLAIKNLIQFASLFSENLLGNKLLFVYNNFPSIDFIEVVFHKTNFRHMTGIQTSLSSSSFFSACLNQLLSPDDFEFSTDGTTELKFQVLDKILNIHTTGRFLGEYKGHRPWLLTDKLVGDHQCCLGLQQNKKYYTPNTVLKSDISVEVYQPVKEILATLRTEFNSSEYHELCYVKSNIHLLDLDLPDVLIDILDPRLFN